MTPAAVFLLLSGFGLWLLQSAYQARPAWEPPPLWGWLRFMTVLWSLERACVYLAILLLFLERR